MASTVSDFENRLAVSSVRDLLHEEDLTIRAPLIAFMDSQNVHLTSLVPSPVYLKAYLPSFVQA